MALLNLAMAYKYLFFDDYTFYQAWSDYKCPLCDFSNWREGSLWKLGSYPMLDTDKLVDTDSMADSLTHFSSLILSIYYQCLHFWERASKQWPIFYLIAIKHIQWPSISTENSFRKYLTDRSLPIPMDCGSNSSLMPKLMRCCINQISCAFRVFRMPALALMSWRSSFRGTYSQYSSTLWSPWDALAILTRCLCLATCRK